MLEKMMLLMIFQVQRVALAMVPVVGTFLSCLHYCWLNAYWAFEYKWNLKNEDVEMRMATLETHWAYFAGFGNHLE